MAFGLMKSPTQLNILIILASAIRSISNLISRKVNSNDPIQRNRIRELHDLRLTIFTCMYIKNHIAFANNDVQEHPSKGATL